MRYSKVLSLFATLLIIAVPVLGQVTFTQIQDNGPRSNRLNLVILGDGYTAGEQAAFDADAVSMKNAYLAEQPMTAYSSYFNVFTIFVVSNESGSDHPSSSIYKDTYFSSTYDSYGITRLITIPPNNFDGNWSNGSGKVSSLLSTYVPEYDIVLIIVNDGQYGGSGGTYAISSTHSASPDVAIHEIGHSFGNLADEYEDYTPGFTGHEAYNSTAETVRANIKWNNWILPTTPIPTPETGTYGSVVGLFEGSTYETTGWYRPKLDCMMRSLGNSFCQVCREQMVRAQYVLVSPVDSQYPAATTINLPAFDTVRVGVTTIDDAGQSWWAEWFIDDTLIVDSQSLSILFDGPSLSQGGHIVRVDLYDSTAYVRNDPSKLLSESTQWNLHVGVTSCCVGISGNVDSDPSEIIDIGDLTLLIGYLFIPPNTPPLCMEEANADGDLAGVVDIGDLTILIGYLFIPPNNPPAGCL